MRFVRRCVSGACNHARNAPGRGLDMAAVSCKKRLLLIGASRGLGLALAAEYINRGWHVVATERNRATSKLHDLVGRSEDRLEIETADINDADQVAALRARL